MASDSLPLVMRRTLPICVVALALWGCGGPGKGSLEEIPEPPEFDVTADAYLFDARATRGGKPTSVRLEIYHTDTLIGIGGRGYLGKGALKGWLTEDSLVVYFPGSNEYTEGTVADLLQSDACSGNPARVPLAGLFTTTPDSLAIDADLDIGSNYLDPDRPKFIISANGCPWRLEIEYRRDDNRWRIDRFDFDNGADLSLTGNLRTVKRNTTVSSRRFTVQIPSDALRLDP